jgi:type II secretory pathway component PulK
MRLQRPNRRLGLTLVPALVCLVVASLLCAALIKKAHTQRLQVRSSEHQAQAEWLAESGLERAVARLTVDRAYAGETWSIPSDAFGNQGAGVVRIVITSVNEPTARKIRVEADYPSGDDSRARQSRTLIVDLGPVARKGPS